MKKLILSFAFVLVSFFTFAQTNWIVDPTHSSVNFTIKHMGVSFVQGRFNVFEGVVSSKTKNLDQASFDFTVHTESIDTGAEMRDKHLKSEEFFDIHHYPTIILNAVTLSKDKNNYLLKGKLMIKDVSKEVSIPVTFGGVTKNKQGKEVMGFSTKFTVNRLDYNINYDPTGSGIAREVEINAYFEVIKQ